MSRRADSSAASTARATWLLFVVAGLSLVFGVPSAIFYLREISSPLDSPSLNQSATLGSSGFSSRQSPSETTTEKAAPHSTVTLGCFLRADKVPCTTQHDSEVFESASCNRDSTIAYLGGLPGVDQLGSSLLTTEQSAGSCRLSGAAVEQLRRSAENILRIPEGDALRACMNTRTGDAVPCNALHNAELIYLGPTDPDCVSHFYTFAGISFARHSQDLRVETSSANSVSCWVVVRSANSLTKSIRGLGAQNLPLE